MADQIQMTVEPNHVQIKTGESATAAVLLRNTSEEVAQYKLCCEGLPTEWAQITPDQVSAFPLEQVSAQIVLHPPLGAPNATFPLEVRAVLVDHPGIETRIELPVTVSTPVAPEPPPMRPSVAPEAARPVAASQIEVLAVPVSDAKLARPGSQWRLTLHNAGVVLDTFGFNVNGIPAQWVGVVPPEVTLKPGEQASALLTVQPEPHARPAIYPFALRTYSHLNLNERTEISLQVAVQPCAGFRIQVSPRAAESQGQREFAISLQSDPNSNMDLQVQLSAQDQDAACDYSFEPPLIQLPARQSATSRLNVRPLAVLAATERRVIAFRVVASPVDNAQVPSQETEAQLTQTGAKPLMLIVQPQVQTADLEAEFRLTVSNPAGVEASLSLSASDPESGCQYFFRPASLLVPPRTQTQALFKVKARSHNDGETSKTFAFTVEATRQGELVPAASAQGQLVQSAIKPLTIQLVPPQQSGPGDARYSLRVENPRPSAVSIWLEAADEADALTIKIRPAMLKLGPHAQGVATLSIHPKDPLMPGEQRRVHKFIVNARMEGPNEPQTVSGVLAQTAGTDWASLLNLAMQMFLWLLRWMLAFVLLVFLGCLVLYAIQELYCRNPNSRAVLGPVLYNPLTSLFYRLPFSGIAQFCVRFPADVLATFVPLPRGCP